MIDKIIIFIIVILTLCLFVISWTKLNFKRDDFKRTTQLEWVDDNSNVLHSSGSGFKERGENEIGTRLRSGDRVKLELLQGGHSIWLGKEMNNPFQDIEFDVLGLTQNEELLKGDSFLLINKDLGVQIGINNSNNIDLIPLNSRNMGLSAADRTNIRGGVTSAISPIYGLNYLFFNCDNNALFWVNDNGLTVKDHYQIHPNHYDKLVQVIFKHL